MRRDAVFTDVTEKTFWSNYVVPINEEPNTTAPLKSDVVIIGGGFTGLAAAWRLAQQGHAVVVLEQGSLGAGASLRNAGFCTISPAASALSILKAYGEVDGRSYFSWFRDAAISLPQLFADAGMDIEWATTGRLSLARSAKQTERLKTNVKIQQKAFGMPVALIEGTALRDQIDSRQFVSALVDDESGALNPALMHAALGRLARRNGATLCEQHRVHELVEHSGAVCVRHSHGEILAKHVLIATNGYTTSLSSRYSNLVLPVQSNLIATAPWSKAEMDRVLGSGRVASTISNFSNYFRFTSDRRLLFGGRRSLNADASPTVVCEELVSSAHALLGTDVEVKPEYCWGGRLAFTADRTPQLGAMTERVYFAGGFCGHGVPTSLASGFHIADRISRENKLSCPFYSKNIRPSLKLAVAKKIVPALSIYYKWLDSKELAQ